MAEAIRKAIQMKKSSLMRTGLTLTLTLALIFVGFYVVTSDTLGWFSANKKVAANGMSVIAEDYDIRTEFFYRSGSTDDYFLTAQLYIVDPNKAGNYLAAPADREITDIGGKDYYEVINNEYVLAFDKEGFRPVSNWQMVFDTLQPSDTVHVKAHYYNYESEQYYATASYIIEDKAKEEAPMKQDVVIHTDNIGDLKTVTVPKVDENGNPVQDENGNTVMVDQFVGEVESEQVATDPVLINYTQSFSEFYYLGSQLFVTSSWTGDHSPNNRNYLTEEDRYFVPNPTKQVCFYKEVDAAQLADVTILKGFAVPAATDAGPGETTLYFEIEFLWVEENQNNYKFKNFGPSGGRCIRHFLTDFSTTPPPPAN